jgi:hypothetical protein
MTLKIKMILIKYLIQYKLNINNQNVRFAALSEYKYWDQLTIIDPI